MQYLWMTLFGLAIVGLDQLTKYLTVLYIKPGQLISAIPGIFSLTYTQNTGAAFSFLQGQFWLFYLVNAALAAFIIWEFPKKKLPFTMFDRWMIVAIFAGGIGNIIDRVQLHYVVDMIHVDFMNFAVFNVADCFITCGCIALCAHLAFFNKAFWKEDKKK